MKRTLTILLLLLAGKLLAQKAQNQDITLLQKAFGTTPKVRLSAQFSLTQDNANEMQMVLSGLFLFYKSFLSSQDNQRCSFHPSCSEYGLEAVKTLGVVRGIVCTCDRLTRCNGFSPKQYEIDMERRRLKDPVQW